MTTNALHSIKSTNGRFWISPGALVVRLLNIAPRLSAAVLAPRFLTPWRRVAALDSVGAARSLAVSVDGQATTAHVWGRGPLVLLMHGWSGGASQLMGLRDTLLAQGYAVVAFDAPAHGGAGGRKVNAGTLRRAVEKICDSLGPVHALVGHSLGGLAVALARENLDVPRLVLLGPMPSFDFALDEFQRLLGCSKAVRDAVGVRVEAIAQLTREQANLERILETQRDVLLVHDVGDRRVPIGFVRPLARKSGVRYVETHGLGHSRLLDDARVHAEIVSFLA